MSEAKSPIAGPPRDVVGYEGMPPKTAWPNGARIAISLVVNYEEGSNSQSAMATRRAKPAARHTGRSPNAISASRPVTNMARARVLAPARYLRRAERQMHLSMPAPSPWNAIAMRRGRCASVAMTSCRMAGAGKITTFSPARKSGSTSAVRSTPLPKPQASGRSGGTAAMGPV